MTGRSVHVVPAFGARMIEAGWSHAADRLDNKKLREERLQPCWRVERRREHPMSSGLGELMGRTPQGE